MIGNFKTSNNAFHAAEFWGIVGLTVFTAIAKEKLHSTLNEGWTLKLFSDLPSKD